MLYVVNAYRIKLLHIYRSLYTTMVSAVPEMYYIYQQGRITDLWKNNELDSLLEGFLECSMLVTDLKGFDNMLVV